MLPKITCSTRCGLPTTLATHRSSAVMNKASVTTETMQDIQKILEQWGIVWALLSPPTNATRIATSKVRFLATMLSKPRKLWATTKRKCCYGWSGYGWLEVNNSWIPYLDPGTMLRQRSGTTIPTTKIRFMQQLPSTCLWVIRGAAGILHLQSQGLEMQHFPYLCHLPHTTHLDSQSMQEVSPVSSQLGLDRRIVGENIGNHEKSWELTGTH